MVLLTLVWGICCIPIFTIGAATTALYYVTFRMVDHTDGYLVRGFLHSFRDNFVQATRVWIICMLTGGVLGFAGWWYYNIGSSLGAFVLPIIAILAILALCVMVYVFPLLSRYQLTDKNLFSISFVMALKNIGCTVFLLVSAGCVIAVGLFVAAPLLVISAGLIADIHTRVLAEVLKQYRADEGDEK